MDKSAVKEVKKVDVLSQLNFLAKSENEAVRNIALNAIKFIERGL